MSIASVRERFSALQAPLAFFDGPGGTQVPDSVIEVISDYLRSANANLGGRRVPRLSHTATDPRRIAADPPMSAKRVIAPKTESNRQSATIDPYATT